MADFELVIRGGTVFDGTGAPPITADVGVRDGKVAAVAPGLPEGARTVDARGQWVVPGLIDVHTHYDAEVLLSPGLGESVRHGTTSVVLGNCSLSTVYSDADDCADMFARVEALPWQIVRDSVKEAKTVDRPSRIREDARFAAARGERGRVHRPLRHPGRGVGSGSVRRWRLPADPC